MPLKPDDIVCLCFQVPLRKIESFCRIEKPKAASQISQCLSAGTGCGWCVPMLRKIHRSMCGQYAPWWRQEPAGEPETPSADLAEAEAYAAGRQKYLAEKGITPPQIPLPKDADRARDPE